MSNPQQSWNQGSQDSNSGKGPSNQNGKSWQEKESYNAGYTNTSQQNSQTGKS